MLLDIVVPTVNAKAQLPGVLRTLATAGVSLGNLIVCDGGSTDGTVELAQSVGARVVTAPRGRGTQLAVGALAGSGGWLLFLHADTTLAEGWLKTVARFIAEPANASRAGYFRFALDDAAPAARRLESLVALRCELFALPYGDQGLLIARDFYRQLGGFRDWPLMEDVEMVRRIGRARLVALPVAAITSAQRYRRNGYLRQSLRNLGLLSLYFFGVPPATLDKWYRG